MKEVIDKLDSIKVSNFCSLKDSVKTVRRQATESKKMFINHISNQQLVSRIYKELLQQNNKKANNLIFLNEQKT